MEIDKRARKKINIKDYGLVILFFILMVIFSLASPNFLTIGNISNILLQNAHVAVACMAVAILMICGGADLSVGYEIALASIIGAMLMEKLSAPIWIAIVIIVLVCVGCSAFNMFLTQILRGNTMIITLATMTIYQGLAYTISNAQNYHDLPDSFLYIGQGRIGDVIPINIIITVVIFIIVAIGLSKTYAGKKIYAVGDNAEAARLAGINVRRIQISAFASAGILIGITCVMLTARAGNATATTGVGLEFTGITACVLGGIPLKGGDGKLWKVIVAAYILGILSNGMQLIGMGAFTQYIAKGAVMLLSIGMTNYNFSSFFKAKRFKKA